jgi:hypothetical protein
MSGNLVGHFRFVFVIGCFLFFFVSCSDSKEERNGAVVADMMAEELRQLRNEMELLAVEFQKMYAMQDKLATQADLSAYEMASNGSFHKAVNDGGAALWISGYVPISDEVKKVAYFTEPADVLFKALCSKYPGIAQVYYNDRNSLNRIYPWFDVLAQYHPKMNIPGFNFYYLADAEHNPGRKGVWVKMPYMDPAGRGWIVSAIAPVYFNGNLEGVCGIDVTVSTIAEKYFNTDKGVFAVLSESGTLVSGGDGAMAILQMPPLDSPGYLEAINKDTYLQDNYNIMKSRKREIRELGCLLIEKKATEAEFKSGTVVYKVFSSKVQELDWLLIQFVR